MRELKELEAMIDKLHQQGVFAKDFKNPTNSAAVIAAELNVPQDLALAALALHDWILVGLLERPTLTTRVGDHTVETFIRILLQQTGVSEEHFIRVMQMAGDINGKSLQAYAKAAQAVKGVL